MPIERFTDENPEESVESTAGPKREAVHDSGRSAGLLRWLKIPGSVSVGIAIGALACFLLTGQSFRPKAGVRQGEGVQVLLEPQTINLADEGASLRMQVVLEASSPRFAAILQQQAAQVADLILEVMSTKKVDDLDSEIERNRLKRELADTIGQRVRSDGAHIANVFFKEFYYESD